MPNSTSTQTDCHSELEGADNIFSALRRARPATKRDLKNYIKVFLEIDAPAKKNLSRTHLAVRLPLA